jgi:3-hydroxybutyryl-CoA dehydrogenase
MDRANPILVIGAGTMGTGIAEVAARSGLRVLLADVTIAQADIAVTRITRRLDRDVARGRMRRDEAALIASRISGASDAIAAAATVRYVIETVPEDPALKMRILGALLQATERDVLIATNTSAISITELAGTAAGSDRIVGMHFFNPVPAMPLVEVVRGMHSSAEAVQSAMALAELMGKEPVEVRDVPGFAVTRINVLIGNEAFRMVREGVAEPQAIDRALKLGLSHPMGPFELGDLVGWDVRLRILEYLHERLGERFLPEPALVALVAAGRLGRKAGLGVYEYPDGPEQDRSSAGR